MARKKTVEIAVINIVIHQDHSPYTYIKLFNDIFEKKSTAQIWRDYHGVLGWLKPENLITTPKGLNGLVYRYVEIDKDLPVLDFDRLAKIEESPPILPDNLKYNVKEIHFYFNAEKHRLFFDPREISPSSLAGFFMKQFKQLWVKNKYGDVDVNVESSEEGIRRIVLMPIIKKLEIYISRPNPDELEDIEKEIYEEWVRNNVKSSKEELRPASKEGLKTKGRTRAKMNMARSNGYVRAVGKDKDGMKIIESTERHPLVKRFRYTPSKMTHWQAIQQHSYEMMVDNSSE